MYARSVSGCQATHRCMPLSKSELQVNCQVPSCPPIPSTPEGPCLQCMRNRDQQVAYGPQSRPGRPTDTHEEACSILAAMSKHRPQNSAGLVVGGACAVANCLQSRLSASVPMLPPAGSQRRAAPKRQLLQGPVWDCNAGEGSQKWGTWRLSS